MADSTEPSSPSPLIAAGGLVAGSALGMAGTFVQDAELRSVLWGLDGTALVAAAALLGVHHVRRGNELAGAGFLVFLAGQAVVTMGSGMELEASAPTFAAGAGLWAAGLAMVSASRVMPLAVRILGLVASALFAVVALQILGGGALTPLSRPLPFFAYPMLVATLLGWAWEHWRSGSSRRCT